MSIRPADHGLHRAQLKRFAVVFLATVLVALGTPLLGADVATAGPGDTFAISDASQVEGNSGEANMVVFTVTLSGTTSAAGGGATYTTTNGTATGGTTCGANVDYKNSSTPGTVTFAPGETSKTISVAVCGDTVIEPNETFSVTLSPAGGTTCSPDCVATGTIITDDAVRVADSSVAEGDAGTTNLSFSASLAGPTSSNVTLNYSTADITASAGSDYTAAAGTATILAGQSSTTIIVPVAGDTFAEADETFALNVSVGSGPATCAPESGGDCQAIGTITNDDGAPRTLSIADVTLAEGDTGTTNATFTITQSGVNAQEVRVRYDTGDETATSGTDYTVSGGVAVIPAGQLFTQVTVPVSGDAVDEVDESFLVNLTNPMNAACAGGDCQARGTITDDEATPTISVSDPTVAEGNAGTVTATFNVTISGQSSSAVTATYATANGSATAGTDYTTQTGTATIPALAMSTTVTVPVLGDTLDENDETFLLNLTGPQNATCSGGDCQGTATITDDEGNPTLSIGDRTLPEGNSGATNAVFTVTLAPASGRTVTVAYATTDVTATAGSDYNATTGTLTFVPGDLTEDIQVPVAGDVLDEPNETFTVNLSNPVDATIADPSGAGTITDDDVAPSVSVDDVTTPEPAPGGADAVFTVTLSAPSSQIITVAYATGGGTATAGLDYTAQDDVLTFPAGVTTRNITVPVLTDTAVEGNETYNVTLTPDLNTAPCASGDCVGVGTIVDDESPSLSVSNAGVTETDSGTINAVFTVTLSTASTQATTFSFATADGSATAGSDYVLTTGTGQIDAGLTSTNVSVPVNGDTLPEPTERFFLNLSSPSGATITDGQGVGTITADDDGTVNTVSVNDILVTEGTADTPTTATFTVTQSSSSNTQSVTVTYTTADDTATAPGDYTTKSGTVTFTPGSTSRTFTVDVASDNIDEIDETFLVNLSNSSNAGIADDQGIGTIDDDDGPALSIDDVTIPEGDAGTTTAAFTVSISGTSLQPVTATFNTGDATATTAGSDYAANTGTVTFPAGTTTAQIVNVVVNGDTTDELTETFTVTLSSPVNATLADGQGTGTITDDDAPTSPTIESVENDLATPAVGNDPTPKIVVSGVTSGDTVRLLDGATVKATKTATGTSVTFNPVETDGEVTLSGEEAHSLTATATDAAGNTSAASAPFVYNLDTVVPATPTITSIEGDNETPATGNDTTPSVVVSGVVAGDTVKILEGATERASKVVGVGQTSVTFNTLESDSELNIADETPHSLTATATDTAANTSAPSAAFVYTRDTVIPGIPTIVSVEGDTATPGAGNDTTPNILLSGVAEGETVTLKDGSTIVGTIVVPAGATAVTFNAAETDSDATLTGDGSHSLTATRTDPAGNTGTASAAFVYALDTTAPAAPVITSVEGDGIAPATGNDPTPIIVVSGVVTGDTVKILDGTTQLASKVVPASATSVTFNNVEAPTAGFDDVTVEGDGDHPLTATATDPTANTSTASAPFVYTLDATAPAIPAIASIEGDTATPAIGNDTTPTIVVSGVVAGDTVKILEGATLRGTKVVPASATTVTFNAADTDTDVTVAGETDHTLTATATDPAGNVSTASPAFVYTLDTAAPSGPGIASVEGDVSTPAAGTDTTPTIVVSGVVAGDTVKILDGTTVVGTAVVPASITTVTFNAAETDADVTLAGDGNHSLTATSTDTATNTSAASAAFVYSLTVPVTTTTTATTTTTTTAPTTTTTTTRPPVAPARSGYRLVAKDGGIFAFGDARFFGSTGALKLNQPIVGMAETPSGNGYWLVASDGGIFAFGDAVFRGSTGAIKLNKPIVGMASTPSGNGYFLVASDGGIFAFGDAVFRGSTGALRLNLPIVGMASTPSGNGYWLVASDGGIFAFGDALFRGSTGAIKLAQPIVGMASTPSGNGYWLVASDGGIFSFGDAAFKGSTGGIPLAKPIVGMAGTPTGAGYFLVASDGGIFAFGDAVFKGSTGAIRLAQPIVGMAAVRK